MYSSILNGTKKKNTRFLIVPHSPFQRWAKSLGSAELPAIADKSLSTPILLNLTDVGIYAENKGEPLSLMAKKGTLQARTTLGHFWKVFSLDSHGWLPSGLAHHNRVYLDKCALSALLNKEPNCIRVASALQSCYVSVLCTAIEGDLRRPQTFKEVLEKHAHNSNELYKLRLPIAILKLSESNKHDLERYCLTQSKRIDEVGKLIKELFPLIHEFKGLNLKNKKKFKADRNKIVETWDRALEEYTFDKRDFIPSLLGLSLRENRHSTDSRISTVEKLLKSETEGDLFNSIMDFEALQIFSRAYLRENEQLRSSTALITLDDGVAVAWANVTPLRPRFSLRGEVSYYYGLRDVEGKLHAPKSASWRLEKGSSFL